MKTYTVVCADGSFNLRIPHNLAMTSISGFLLIFRNRERMVNVIADLIQALELFEQGLPS